MGYKLNWTLIIIFGILIIFLISFGIVFFMYQSVDCPEGAVGERINIMDTTNFKWSNGVQGSFTNCSKGNDEGEFDQYVYCVSNKINYQDQPRDETGLILKEVKTRINIVIAMNESDAPNFKIVEARCYKR